MSHCDHVALACLVALATAVACGSDDSRDRGTASPPGRTGSGSAGPVDPGTQPDVAAGFELDGPPGGADRPTGPLRSPSGRLVETGMRDELGYVLPLDIKRPRPAWERAAPPDRAAIERARAEFDRTRTRGAAAAFPEHRLGPDDGHTHNETSIAAHGDTVVAGWNNYTDATLDLGVASSHDGGQSWTWDLIGGHGVLSDPVVKAGENGRWYYAYIAGGGPGGGDIDVYVRRSLDGGVTWSNPTLVTFNSSFDDKPYMDARGDEVLVGYADFGVSPAKVRAVRSLDGGLSFGNDTVVANNSGGGNGACPVIDPNGIYYMFWRDSFQESLWVSRSTDQGATWSPDRGIVAMSPLPSSLPPGFRMVNLPSADADPLTGDLVVVWNDQRFGNPDVLSIRSIDGGQTWSSPVRVNDDSGAATQFFPWVTFDEAGTAHVVWYDRRENGADIDVYVARSLDGGQTYEANTRVTMQAFTPILPWESHAVQFIGDYNGIAATAQAVYPFYQDAREGNQDVYAAVLPGGATGVAAGDAAPAGGAPSPIRPRLVASPSPFRSSTTLRAEGLAAGVPLEIVSVSGKRVRRITLGRGGVAVWDGRDDGGRMMPRGVYFVRAVERSGPATRLVKVD